MKLTKLILAGLISACACVQAAETRVVGAGETAMFDVTGAENVSNGSVYDLKAGATLKLTGSPSAGTVPVILWRVAATNGNATIDASALGVDAVQFARGFVSTGTLTVTGMKKLVLGWEASLTNDFDWPSCGVEDVSFTDEGAQGIELYKKASVLFLPPAESCAVTWPAGACIALHGPNLFNRFIHDNVLDVDNYDLVIQSVDAVPENTTIKVAANRSLRYQTIRNVPPTGFHWFSWAGYPELGDHEVTNNVQLLDATANLIFTQRPGDTLNLRGSISGAGNILTKELGGVNGLGKTEIHSDMSGFTGHISASVGTIIRNVPQTNVNFTTPVYIGNGAKFGVKTLDYENQPTTVKGNLQKPAGNMGTYWGYRNQTIELGSLNFFPKLDCEDSSTTFVVNEIAKDVGINQTKNFKLVIENTAAPFSNKYSFNDAGSKTGALELGEDAKLLEIDVATGNTLRLSGTGTVGTVKGGGKIVFEEGAEISIAQISDGTVIDASNGKLNIVPANWQSKVRLWIDPSDAASIVYLQNKARTTDLTFLGYNLVHMCLDKRPEQTYWKLMNDRHSSYKEEPFPQCYPYLVTQGGPNNLPYLCFGGYNTANVAGAGKNGDAGNESRRIDIFTPDAKDYTYHNTETMESPWVIMIFGSQQGGGNAIMASPDATYNRAGQTLDNYVSASNFAMYMDGSSVNPAATKFNGGWQLLSFAGSNKVKGLGYKGGSTIGNTFGGQNYGEVIFFSEMPNELERIACERYLAKKWGIDVAQYQTEDIELASGTKAGEVSVANGVSLKLQNNFVGTVNVENGATVTIPSLRKMMSEAEVPGEGRLSWFDPNYEGALVHSGYASRPLAIDVIKSRTNDGIDASSFMLGTSGPGASDRRPCLLDASRGGDATKWMTFDDYYNDKDGNMLRRQTGTIPELPNSSNESVPMNVRTAFVVLDTTNGGGTPLTGNNTATDVIMKRVPTTDVNQPIWPEGTVAAVTSGTTRLDGEVVNGTTSGYSGRPEVLTLETTDNALISYFGFYGGAAATLAANPNTLIMGESLFYDRILSQKDREDVEAYLMFKWLGKVAPGYGDFSNVTLKGSGTVLLDGGIKALPTVASDFSGTIELTESEMSFTVDSAKTPAVEPALIIPGGTVKFANEVTINVSVAGKLRPGAYTLVSAGTVIAPETFTFNVTGDVGSVKTSLKFENDSVIFNAIPSGTVLIIR